MFSLARQQYEWVLQTRERVLSYCRSLPEEGYTHAFTEFGDSSIRSLHVHIAECYLIWLGKFTRLRNDISHPECVTPDDVGRLFGDVDSLVDEFLSLYEPQFDSVITGHVRWQEAPLAVTPAWLYSHTVTHEFHHKGQMVSMGRHLGHVAPDTDLVLPRLPQPGV